MRVFAVFVVLLATRVSAQMLNDQGPPQLRVVHKNTFALRVNPLGLIYDGRFSVRERLFVSDSKALRDNFIGVGLLPCASPAFFRIGPFIEFNPISMFGVYAAIQYVQYFGTIDLAQGFAGAQSNFSDSAIKANSATNHMATNGWDLTFGATFQTKVWNLLIRDQAKLVRGVLKLKEGQRIYYDQYFDVGAPALPSARQPLDGGRPLHLHQPVLRRATLRPGRRLATQQCHAPSWPVSRLQLQDARWRGVQQPHGVLVGAVVGGASLPHRARHASGAAVARSWLSNHWRLSQALTPHASTAALRRRCPLHCV
jgi:hypothetical protein